MTEPLTHRPAGSGHPYRFDPDQRHPVQLVGGEPFELRVLAHDGVEAVVCELDNGSRRPMVAVTADELYGPGASPADGHLSAASGARPDLGTRRPWRTTLVAPVDGAVRYRFSAMSASGDAVASDWFDAPVGVWRPDGGRLDVVGAGAASERVVDGAIRWLVTARGAVRVRFDFELGEDEHVVGFGERFDALDQRGQSLDTVVFEQYKQQGKRTYLPSPFAIVTGSERAGWGFHIRTSRRARFDIGRRRPDRIGVDVGVDPADPTIEIRCYDGAPADVLGAHVAETGGLRRPPDWVFGPWMSGNDWNTQSRVVAEVERSIELGVPVGAVVIEAWSDEATFTVFRDARYAARADGGPLSLDDFTFPADGAWPDPAGMVQHLHGLGVKVLLWQIPLVPTDRSDARGIGRANGQVEVDAAIMIERGLCVAEADGSPYRNRGWWFTGALLPDWTNPEVSAWWLAKRRYLLDEVGVDGFKTDGGEHAWGDDLRYADGTRGDVSNNVFAQRYAEAYTSLLDECGVDGVTFSRAGYTGAGRAPVHWAGDEDSTWEAFRASIIAGLTAGLSGVAFWGWDLAGFSGEIPSVELYVRASAMAALSPIMQYHSEYDEGRTTDGAGRNIRRDRTPWNIVDRHGDDRALTLYRRFAVLRHRLRPYLVEQADRSVATGVPMMRALCLGFPGDPTVWSYPMQYQFGEALLVAPICHEGASDIEVYLPAGDWVDAWSGDRLSGPLTLNRSVPVEEIAVYVDARRGDDLLPAFQGLPDGGVS